MARVSVMGTVFSLPSALRTMQTPGFIATTTPWKSPMDSGTFRMRAASSWWRRMISACATKRACSGELRQSASDTVIVVMLAG